MSSRTTERGIAYALLGAVLLLVGIAVSWRLLVELIGLLVAALGLFLLLKGIGDLLGRW
ncbi:MAG: hypothetical protein QXO17_00070 [Nitrososphaerota archaeon]|nr:hypothetical protein [Candidatus Calditenuis fumarioli]